MARYIEDRGSEWNMPKLSNRKLNETHAFDVAENSLSNFEAFKETFVSGFSNSGTASVFKFAKDFYDLHVKSYDKDEYMQPDEIKRTYGIDSKKALPIHYLKEKYDSKLDYEYSQKLLKDYSKKNGGLGKGVQMLGQFTGYGVASLPLLMASWMGALRVGTALSALAKAHKAKKLLRVAGFSSFEGYVAGVEGYAREAYNTYAGYKRKIDWSNIAWEVGLVGVLSGPLEMFTNRAWYTGASGSKTIRDNVIPQAKPQPGIHYQPLPFTQRMSQELKSKVLQRIRDKEVSQDMNVRKSLILSSILSTPIERTKARILTSDPLDIQTAKILLESPLVSSKAEARYLLSAPVSRVTKDVGRQIGNLFRLHRKTVSLEDKKLIESEIKNLMEDFKISTGGKYEGVKEIIDKSPKTLDEVVKERTPIQPKKDNVIEFKLPKKEVATSEVEKASTLLVNFTNKAELDAYYKHIKKRSLSDWAKIIKSLMKEKGFTKEQALKRLAKGGLEGEDSLNRIILGDKKMDSIIKKLTKRRIVLKKEVEPSVKKPVVTTIEKDLKKEIVPSVKKPVVTTIEKDLKKEIVPSVKKPEEVFTKEEIIGRKKALERKKKRDLEAAEQIKKLERGEGLDARVENTLKQQKNLVKDILGR